MANAADPVRKDWAIQLDPATVRGPSSGFVPVEITGSADSSHQLLSSIVGLAAMVPVSGSSTTVSMAAGSTGTRRYRKALCTPSWRGVAPSDRSQDSLSSTGFGAPEASLQSIGIGLWQRVRTSGS